MIGQLIRRAGGCLALALFATSLSVAMSRTLSDHQLDAVYAAGFDVAIEMQVDVDASKPEALLVTGSNAEAVQSLLNTGMTLAASRSAGRNAATFNPNGEYMPNLQNLTFNNINISENALANASTLMNIFALEGDVAVGINLTVVVNPATTFSVSQNNYNWSSLLLSEAP